MTSKEKGRPKRGQLVDMGIYPSDNCYEPPLPGDYEVIDTPIELDEGHRLYVTPRYRRGTAVVVMFGIQQSILEDLGGVWRPVARIDTWHSEVHRHQFTQKGGNEVITLEPIPAERGEQVISRWFPQAERIMQEEWLDNVRRWRGADS